MENIVDKIESLLQSEQRLERDKGIVELKVILSKPNQDEVAKTLLGNFQEKLAASSEATKWEVTHGCLLGAKCILETFIRKENAASIFDDLTAQFFHAFALKALTHSEVRVRNISGEFLGTLCKVKGSGVYKQSSDVVLKLLQGDLQRHIEPDVAGLEEEELPEPHPASPGPFGADAANIFHESAGWRHLETTMKCLQCMIEGCGKSFNSFITQDLLDLLFSALTHTNRFVRETGFNVCAAVVRCGQTGEAATNDSVVKYGKQFSKYLAKGLADNWSQVRLASSVATRNFLLSISDEHQREQYFPDLIPRLCLNRYYIAEGVRIYSQETWKQVSDGHGKDLVEKYISSVSSYYIESTQADNHAVREAACACISELATKINEDAVRKHVLALLNALLDCFQDDSWPVRDAACVACGNFILSYAEEAREKRELLYGLFLANLRDPIPSVREGAGAALAKYAKAYGDEVLPVLMKEINEGLEEVAKQPENSDKFTGLDKRPAQFGVVKNLHDNNNEADKRYTDQQMYSCGSLAPKMGRGSRGGCSDCRFRRPSEPWERSDGCVYLITELAGYYPQKAIALLPAVATCLSHKHFSQHLVLLETVCKQLPILAKRVGKRAFKMNLESFFDSIFDAVTCDVQLTVAAAEDCLIQLGKFIGPSILRGRLENYNPLYIEQYDHIITQACLTPPVLSPSGHNKAMFQFTKA